MGPFRAANVPARRPSGRAPRRAAFSLFELMLVLTILVVVGALAYPALRGPFETQRLKKSAELIRTEWARARLRAMRTGRVHVFRYTPSATQYLVETWATAADDLESVNDFQPTGSNSQGGVRPTLPTSRTSELPEGVRFFGGETAMDGRATQWAESAGMGVAGSGNPIPVLFYPDGTTSEAALILVNNHQQCVQVTLRGLTGSSLASAVQTLEEVFQ